MVHCTTKLYSICYANLSENWGFIICTLHQILLGLQNQGGLDGQDMQHTGKTRNAYIILAGKAEGKRPLGRTRCRWEDLREMGVESCGLDSSDSD
jgi:hypothetical protein